MSELVAKPIAVAGLVGFAKSSTHPTKPIVMIRNNETPNW